MESTSSIIERLSKQVGFLGVSLGDVKKTIDAYGIKGLKNLFSNQLTEFDLERLNYYNELIKTGADASEAREEAEMGASKAARELMENAGNAAISEEVLADANKKVATSSKLASAAMSTLFNIGISIAISVIIKCIESLAKANERVAESAEKAIDSYKDAQSTLKSNKETIEEISSDYEKLSKGVDKFGNNISLSTDEYERYQEISQKIADMFPELIGCYNEEGQAIIDTATDVNVLTEAYEKQAIAAKTAFLQSGKDVYKNASNNLKGTLLSDGEIKKLKIANDILSNLDDEKKLTELFYVYKGSIQDVLKDAGYDVPLFGFGQSDKDKKAIAKIKENVSLLKNYVSSEKQEITSQLSDTKNLLLTNLEINSDDYQKLTDNNKKVVQAIINSLDEDYLFKADFNGNLNKLYNDFQQKLSTIFNDKGIANEFEFMIDIQTKLNNGDATIGAYQSELDRFIKSISGLDDETQKYIKLSLGLELDENGQDKNIKNVIAQLVSSGVEESWAKDLVGKLKLPEFEHLLQNGGQFKDSVSAWLKENQGATAEEFEAWFNEILTQSAASVEDSSSKILTAFQKATDAVTDFKSALDSTKSGTEAFEGYAEAYKTAKDLIDEGYDLDNGKLYSALEFLLGEDTLKKYGYNIDKLKGKFKELGTVFGDSDSLGEGLQNALKNAVDENGELKNAVGDVIATYGDGKWFIDNAHLGEVADALGITEDGLVACIQAMSTWSDVTLESLDEIKNRAKAAGAVYSEQFEGKDIVNVATLETNLKSNGYTDKQTYDAIQQLKNDKNVITIDVKADSNAESIIEQLSKLGLTKQDGDGKPTLDLVDTIDVLKGTGASLTDITDIITTLNDSGKISIKVDGKTTDDLGVLREKIEELYNYTALGAERAQKKLLELGLTKANITFETGDWQLIDDYLDSARETLNQFRKEDGTIDLSIAGAEEAKMVLIQLLTEKQKLDEPTVMSIDTSQFDESQADMKNAIDKVQEFINLKNQLELQTELGIDTTETQKALREVATQIENDIPDSVKTDLGLNTEEFDKAVSDLSSTTINVDAGLSLSDDSISTVTSAIQNIPTQNIKVGIDINEEDKTAEVKYNVDSSEVEAYKEKSDDKTATVTYHKVSTEVDRYDPKNLSRTVTYHVKTEGSVNANGTANVSGTAHVSGTAKAGGDWGTAKGGTALVGELGTEIVCVPSTGKWYTVGDNGAEFTNIPQGAIVFNHKQTEALLKYGRIDGRGTALASGTAMASGAVTSRKKKTTTSTTSTSKSSTTSTKSSSSKSTTSSSKTSSSSSKSSSSTKSSSSSSSSSKSSSSKSSSSSSTNSSSSSDSKAETTDWIEIAIKRVERLIDNLATKAKSTYQSLKTRLSATSDEISKVGQEINLQQQAAARYMQQANSVGLSSALAQKVREGTIDINDYDDSTAELIKDYQTWYEKSLACSDAVQTLNESLAGLYKDKFDDIQKDYENQLSLIEYLAKDYENRISAIEAKGYLESTEIYKSLQEVETENISVMEKELADLQLALNQAVNSGKIAEYSEAWYSMKLEIEGVKEAIDEANVKLLEYQKTMREIEWGYFDYIQERISQITQEGSFLIDLMSDLDLYDDKGQFNDYGKATLGVRAQDYNVYMAQADEYAKEILSLDKSIANDPYNTDLIKRREELLKLQQESIKSANDEKKAIVDLVEDGIEKELSSLKELINTFSDSLDAVKNLNEYRNKIADKTSNISSLQKQLLAYENDTSEETKATIQKLKVELDNAQMDLEETQYEQYITDQKKLLDELYTEYETVLNQRLDDVDLLVSDMIDTVNINAESINSTLNEVSDSVGYTMTDNMQKIWDGSINAIDGTLSTYGEKFDEKITSVNTVLNSIQAGINQMIGESGKATGTAATVKTDTSSSQKASTPSSTINAVKETKTTSNNISVGSTINAKGAKIYDYAGAMPERQDFADDPIYKVLAIKNGWIQVRWHKLSKGVTGWFKQSDVKAYKTGGLVDYTGLAQLDGTPSKPEMVLNSQDTKNFLDFNDNLREFAKQPITYPGQEYAGYSTMITHSTPVSNLQEKLNSFQNPTFNQTTNVKFGDIKIDHVSDYNDFVTQLQHDKHFEDMINAMTLDRCLGGNPLAKYKYRWK